jgi:hypothetical protein
MNCTLLLLLVLQQLAVEPFPAEVGQPVVVRASAAGRPLPAVGVEVVQPDGQRLRVGETGAAGEVPFIAAGPGSHTFVATIDGVQILAPLSVLPPRRRWPYVLTCVPLGLVLLLRIWRAADRRDRAATASR